MDQRPANAIGCTVLLGVALVAVPLLLAVLLPWEPPRASGAPHGAVLRVVAPEDRHYLIDWDSTDWGSQAGTASRIEEGRYRDHALPDRAMSSYGPGTETIEVEKATSEGEPFEVSADAWEGQMYAILYVDGKTVSCASADSSGATSYGPSVGWDGSTPDLLERKICDGYRYWSYLF